MCLELSVASGDKMTSTPSTWAFEISANARSKSPAESTCAACILSENPLAAVSVSAKPRLASTSRGVRKTPTRIIFGRVSLSISNRLPLRSDTITVSPVTFPPGRAKLFANPVSIGLPLGHDDGNYLRYFARRQRADRRSGNNDIDFIAHELGGEFVKPLLFPFGVFIFELDIFALGVAPFP